MSVIENRAITLVIELCTQLDQVRVNKKGNCCRSLLLKFNSLFVSVSCKKINFVSGSSAIKNGVQQNFVLNFVK